MSMGKHTAEQTDYKEPGWLRRQWAEHPRLSALAAAALGSALTLGGVIAVEAANGPTDRAGYDLFDDPAWPANAKLQPRDCSPGTPIDRQRMQQFAGSLIATVDSRCEPPVTQQYAGVYTGSSYDTRLVGRVYNGQRVIVTCVEPGVPDADVRGGTPNNDWFGVRYQDGVGDVHYGHLNGGNLGHLDPASAPGGEQLPACS